MNANQTRMLSAVALVIVLTLSQSGTASAQESGGLGGIAKGLNPMNWKMPEFKMPTFKSLLPGATEKDLIIKKKDGLMSEIGKSASNSWQRTKQTLNPMNVLPIGNKTNVQTTETKKPGFFSRLFTPPVGADNPDTVTDFLKQDRPAP